MRKIPVLGAAALSLALSSPLAAQDASVVSAAELDAALEVHGRSAADDRSVISRVLDRPDVRAAADDAGLGDRLQQARASVGGLSGDALERAADHARTLEQELAGGQVISFNVTTLIIVLLLVILIILIAE